MLDLLLSDTAILALSCLGLVVTTLSIVRDARAQHAGDTEKLPVEA